MEWHFKEYEQLNLTELYDFLNLRATVFIVEQSCIYLDLDGRDAEAILTLWGIKKTNSLPILAFLLQVYLKKSIQE